jgi:phthiocerol/phenolphthiocerol synthesis type-I polyketide synthase C
MTSMPPSAAAIEAWMTGRVAEELGTDASAVDALASFASHGLASRDLIGLSGELEEWLGTTVSPVVLYEHPTIRALASHLAAGLAPAAAASPDAGAVGADEPIAIIGMDCRFPGARDAAGFWDVLAGGRDCVSEVPADRWSQENLERLLADREDLRTRWGGFIEEVDLFDAEFFGIAPREAVHIDPQQRLLLEVAWDALADAGLRAPDLAGAPVGVFVGISLSEYGNAQLVDLRRISSYTATGGALSIAANRLSYLFDFRGPSVAVDTACSSSLVAVHLACQSLRSGESSVALAAGANLILTPGVTVNFSDAGVMAADGRCKVFDARADGYVRAEGVGVVVLKPLSRALADGDRIHALVLGSAVNQDGRTNGLMAPNPQSQEALLRSACRAAGVSPADVAYVEAHGTGTFLGDPIEAKALGAVYGAARGEAGRCRIGSVKSNMGHLEAAAGIAGLLKTALALRHGTIPPSLHFETPNPHIPFDALRLEVQRELGPWPGPPARRLAGVSSFGFGGANAHAILASAPDAPAPESGTGSRSDHVLTLTAASDPALRATAERWAGWLRTLSEGDDAPDFGRICATAAARRTHLDHRLAVIAGDATTAAARLQAYLAGDEDPAAIAGAGPGHGAGVRRVVFVCPGQGGQWVGMARRLWREEPVFREALRRTAVACAPHIDWDFEAALLGDELPTRIDVVQPLLFGIAVGLAELWESVGVAPDAVVGHSLGEVAAAHIAGALGLDDAARVICWRSRLLARISGMGAMATAELAESEAAGALRGLQDRVSVAAVNGPTSILLAGDPAAVDQVVARLEATDVFCRRVAVDVAAHSPQVEPLAAELAGLLDGIRPGAARLAMHSTVTGRPIAGKELDAAYWASNLRQPVRFGAAIENLREAGHRTFIELGPHPVLLHAVASHFPVGGTPPALIASMRRDGDDRHDFLAALARLFVDGHDPDWSRIEPDRAPPLSLPAYPWQRQRYWFEPAAGSTSLDPRGGAGHPLLGARVPLAVDDRTAVWESVMGATRPGYLADHAVQGRVLFPAAGYIEAGLAAGAETFPGRAILLADLEFQEALELKAEAETRVQLVVVRELPGEATFRVASLAGEAPSGHAVHARGTIRALPAAAEPGPPAPAPLARLRERCGTELDAGAFYGLLRRKGLEYGPAFRRIVSVARGDGEVVAKVAAAPAGKGYALHPTLLDAAFQGLVATLPAGLDQVDELLLPVGLTELRLHRAPTEGEELWVYTRRAPEPNGAGPNGAGPARGLRGDAWLLDARGAVLATVTGLRARRLAARDGDAGDDPIGRWFHEVEWVERPLGEASAPETNGGRTARDWVVLCHPGTPIEAGLAAALEAAGQRPALAFPGEGFRRTGPAMYEVAPSDPAAFRALVESVTGDGDGIRGVIHAWGVPPLPGASLTLDMLEQCIALASDAALHLVQALADAGPCPAPRLYLLTADGPAGDTSDEAALPSAVLEGMARSISHEHAELRCTTVDVPARPDEATIASLVREVLADDDETQVALQDGQRRVGRIRRATLDPAPPEPAAGARRPEPGRPYRARIGEPGLLDSFVLDPATRRPPAAGEVEIAVVATGLNFLDLLTALGTRPDGSDDEAIGAECAGRVLAVGAGVADLVVGDEVVALATDAASAVVVTPAELAAPVPTGLELEAAASIPIAFVTAWYALRDVARLRAGERVLIHSAATGTGLAALHLARDTGAEVFATAGNESKRAYLRSLGIAHVMDSRSLDFAEQVRAATGGAGVDIVFNSLAGDAIPAGLALLRAGGRFLELGKRDVYANRPVGMRALRRNVSITVIDLASLAVDDPARTGSMLRSVLALVEAGRLSPLPRELFPIHEAPMAMRWMAQAGHTGKIVLTHPDGLVARQPA